MILPTSAAFHYLRAYMVLPLDAITEAACAAIAAQKLSL